MSRGCYKGVRAVLFFAILLTAVLAVSTATPANAASYFVNIATGSDLTGDGSPATPWKTLHYAMSQLAADGDAINLAPGVYDITHESDASLFTSFDNISIYGYSGGGTIIDGTGAASWTSGFMTAKDQTIHLAYLTIRNFSVAGVYFNDAMSLSAAPTSSVTACEISNNAYGVKVEAGPVAFMSEAFIAGNKIHHNTTAGIYIYTSVSASMDVDIINNLIYSNLVGIEVHNTGGALIDVLVNHNTIVGGSGGYEQVIGTVTGSILNNIIASATYGISITGAGPVSNYNDVWNCTTPYAGTASAGVNDVSADPLFTSAYRLKTGSPCLDSAMTTATPTDLDGTSRPIGPLSDRGCYEGAVSSYSLTFAPGTTAADYVIKSIPCNPENPTPTGTFGPYIGTYDTTQMRMGYWEPDIQGYMEYPGDNGTIHPGEAAWFLFRNGLTVPINGTPASVSSAPSPWLFSAHPVLLSHGWNQIGNPFNYPISVAGNNLIIEQFSPSPYAEPISAATLTQGVFWVWVNGTYLSASKLNATMGGWLYFNGDTGYAWFSAASVPYPLVERENVEFQTVDLSVARPPSPPGVLDSGASGGASGGGGGGGCFIGQPDRRE